MWWTLFDLLKHLFYLQIAEYRLKILEVNQKKEKKADQDVASFSNFGMYYAIFCYGGIYWGLQNPGNQT